MSNALEHGAPIMTKHIGRKHCGRKHCGRKHCLHYGVVKVNVPGGAVPVLSGEVYLARTLGDVMAYWDGLGT
jgi:hypothetical protein